MRRRGLRALQPKAYTPRTTNSTHLLRCAPNRLHSSIGYQTPYSTYQQLPQTAQPNQTSSILIVPAENEAAHEIPSSSWAACRRGMAARQLRLRNKETKLR